MSKSIGSVALERRVDALFSRYTRPGSPGAVAAVMRGSEIELCKGYGLASIELGVPIGPKTRFRIASVSKQFTVSAALMLAEEGKLKLSDPPHKYLSELKPLPVTIDQMMRNASGLPDFLELLRLGGHSLDKPARLEDLLAACVRNNHLNFAPGSRFLYSNSNFLLLGLIIEKLTGNSVEQEFQRRIFTPLGLRNTHLPPRTSNALPAPYPNGYQFGTNVETMATQVLSLDQQAAARAGILKPLDATHDNPSWGWTAGSGISTAEDLARYAHALVGGGLLNDAMQKQRLASIRPINPADPKSPGYGLALAQFGPVFGHTGELPGYNSFMGHDPRRRITIVVWSSLAAAPDGRAPAVEMAKAIIGHLYGGQIP